MATRGEATRGEAWRGGARRGEARRALAHRSDWLLFQDAGRPYYSRIVSSAAQNIVGRKQVSSATYTAQHTRFGLAEARRSSKTTYFDNQPSTTMTTTPKHCKIHAMKSKEIFLKYSKMYGISRIKSIFPSNWHFGGGGGGAGARRRSFGGIFLSNRRISLTFEEFLGVVLRFTSLTRNAHELSHPDFILFFACCICMRSRTHLQKTYVPIRPSSAKKNKGLKSAVRVRLGCIQICSSLNNIIIRRGRATTTDLQNMSS